MYLSISRWTTIRASCWKVRKGHLILHPSKVCLKDRQQPHSWRLSKVKHKRPRWRVPRCPARPPSRQMATTIPPATYSRNRIQTCRPPTTSPLWHLLAALTAQRYVVIFQDTCFALPEDIDGNHEHPWNSCLQQLCNDIEWNRTHLIQYSILSNQLPLLVSDGI